PTPQLIASTSLTCLVCAGWGWLGRRGLEVLYRYVPLLDSSLEARVPDGLGDGSEARIISDIAPETVGDVPHSKAGLQIGPTDGCASAPMAEGPQWIAG